MTSPEVLVVGAGPTGLVLAFVLARLGVRVRVVDKTAEPGTTSRALAVQARTLELYRQLGLADVLVARGLPFKGINFWANHVRRAHADLSQTGRGLSPYPYGIIFPQDEHEKFLVERLEGLGVSVERRTELLGFDAGPTGIVAKLRGPGGGIESCEAAFLAGCDGARSVVRASMGVDFPGGTYDHLFYVADVEASGPVMNQEIHVVFDDTGFIAIFPLAGEGRARVIGTIREDLAGRGDALAWEDIDRRPIDGIGLSVERVNWFSTYRVHHRVAASFRKGPAFLLGDAAHIHSPVGGQGMNTGIGDAINLAWKLAAVLQGRARQDVLDTYEPERIAFARRLVATTDRAFQMVTSRSRVAEVLRLDVVPALFSRLSRTNAGSHFLFRTVSQTAIQYRKSTWSQGGAGRVRGGDRLPWVEPDHEGAPDNFTPLQSLDWQLHVHGDPPSGLSEGSASRGIPLHVFAFSPACKRAGMSEHHAYLVRPDGHVGAVFEPSLATDGLLRYLDTHAIRPRAA